jgi:hypothetical protein
MFYLILEPLHPYEELRLRQCMANSARLQQLGLPDFIPNGQRTAANSKDRNKTNERNREDADYDPLHDDTGEQDLFDDDIAKVMILASCQGLYWYLFGNAI